MQPIKLKPELRKYEEAKNFYIMLRMLNEPGFRTIETRDYWAISHVDSRLTTVINKETYSLTNPKYIPTMVDLYLRRHGTTWKKCLGYKNRVFSKPSRPESGDSMLYHFVSAGTKLNDKSFWLVVRTQIEDFLDRQYSYRRPERIKLRNRLTAYKFMLDELELPSIYGVLDE